MFEYMKRSRRKLNFILCLLFAFSISGLNAVDTSLYRNWQNADPRIDDVMGVSVEKAYSKLLKGKTPQKVVVAVIDAGIDLQHEDLQGVLWINKNEIANNGIDDDNNGYIDDLNGWNFIGNNKGKNISKGTQCV